MRNIYKIIILLGMTSVLNAGFPNYSLNEAICAMIGEDKMNGDSTSIDMETCEKLDELNPNPKKSKANDKSCIYSDIVKMHIDKYSNFKYTGWSGSAKIITDKMQLGIDILTDIKKCNIDEVAKANNKMIEDLKNINDNIGGVEDSVNEALNSVKIVKDFLNSTMDMYDCSYDCEKHKPIKDDLSTEDKLTAISNGSLDFTSIKDESLYNTCKAYMMGCLSNEFLQDGLKWDQLDLLKEDIKKKANELNEGINNDEYLLALSKQTALLQTDIDDSIATFKGDGSSGLSESLKTFWNPYNALTSEATSCNGDLPELRLSLELPNLDMCNLSDFDADDFSDKIGENYMKSRDKLEKDLELYKEQLIEFLIASMTNSILDAVGKAKIVSKLMKVQKMAVCSIQALLLSVTDEESLIATKEKFSMCRDRPEKVSSKMSVTGGVKWFTTVVPPGVPLPLPYAGPTGGGGVTLNPKEMGTATLEFASCLMEGLGAGYKKAYSKCLKGEEMGLTMDFMKYLNFNILPELDKVKKIQCFLDEDEKRKDVFRFLAENITQNVSIFVQEELVKKAKDNKTTIKERQLNSLKKLYENLNSFNQAKVWGVYFFESLQNECVLKKLLKDEKHKLDLNHLESDCRKDFFGKVVKLNSNAPINLYGEIEISLREEENERFFIITPKGKKTLKIGLNLKQFQNIIESSNVKSKFLINNTSLKEIHKDLYKKNIFMKELIKFTGKEGVPKEILFGGEIRISDDKTNVYKVKYASEPNFDFPITVIPYYKFKIGQEKNTIKTIVKNTNELKKEHKKIFDELISLEKYCSNMNKVKNTNLKGCLIFKAKKTQLIQLFKGANR